MKLKILSSSDDYFNAPDACEINLSLEEIDKILERMNSVRELDCLSVADYADDPEGFTDEDESEEYDEDIYIELSIRKTWETSVAWHFYVKHSGVSLESEMLYKEDLEEIKKVLSAPLKDMPLYIDNKSERLKEIAIKRLKEKK